MREKDNFQFQSFRKYQNENEFRVFFGDRLEAKISENLILTKITPTIKIRLFKNNRIKKQLLEPLISLRSNENIVRANKRFPFTFDIVKKKEVRGTRDCSYGARRMYGFAVELDVFRAANFCHGNGKAEPGKKSAPRNRVRGGGAGA